VISVLTLAGNYIKEESTSNLIHLICSTPQLQHYATYRLYEQLERNISSDGLAKAAIYCFGEFALLLCTGPLVVDGETRAKLSESVVIDIIAKVIAQPQISDTIIEYSLNCLIKLYTKFATQKQKILDLI